MKLNISIEAEPEEILTLVSGGGLSKAVQDEISNKMSESIGKATMPVMPTYTKDMVGMFFPWAKQQD